MSDLKNVESSEFEKTEDSLTSIEIWRFEFEDGRVDYEKEAHIHHGGYVNFKEDIDKEEHDKLLKKLVNSEKWEEVE